MKSNLFLVKRKLFLALFFLLSSQRAFSLNCSEVRQLNLLYLKMHFLYHDFTNEISERTLGNFIKYMDPGKLYYYQSDVDGFKKKYNTKLDDMIIGDVDCSAIDDLVNVYSKRFDERQKMVSKQIDSKFNFTIDEYLIVDRDKMEFAKSKKELNERWRKRVKYQMLDLKYSMDDMKKARAKLHKRYALASKRHKELTKDKIYSMFLNSFSTALDPHSSYLSADTLEDFRIRTRLSLEGIGATLRSDDGYTIVAKLVKGGAAYKGGKLKKNDKIIEVAQAKGEPVDVVDMDLQDVVKKIRGPRGTVVKLTVLRDVKGKATKVIIPITREKVELKEQQAASHLIKLKDGQGKSMKVGVVTLPSFYIDFEGRHRNVKDYRSSANDTKREIKKLKSQGIDALIIDLRNNGGGSLDESITMAGLFFSKGPVVQVKSSTGDIETYYDRDPATFYDGPLVVMINRNSASASEIFSGAIKDYQRGVVVGDTHTFGKGTVQNLHELQGKYGAIKVTINEFYRASGASTQLKGVSSDIQMPSILEDLEIGEKFYDYALPYERIKEAKHPLMKRVQPYVNALTKRSSQRVKGDSNFKEIDKDIKEYRKNKEERSRVSLKENKNDKKEKEDDIDFDDDAEWNLEEDAYMQEAAKIAVDYAQLLSKKTPKGQPAILGLKAKKAKKNAKSVADKNQDKKTSPKVDQKNDKALIKKK